MNLQKIMHVKILVVFKHITKLSNIFTTKFLSHDFLTAGPLITVVIHAIGTWKTQLIGALLLLGSSIASGFATEYWHVIISYGIVEGWCDHHFQIILSSTNFCHFR